MIYTLKDGSKVEVPADTTPEEKAWLTSQGASSAQPSVLKDTLKSAASALQDGAIRAPFILGDMSTLAANFIGKTFDKNAKDRPLQSDQVIGHLRDAGMFSHKPETAPGRYAAAGASAVGGSALGGLGALRVPQIIQNASIGLGGELAGDVSRGFDETQEQNPLMKAAGAGGVAIATALGSRFNAPKFAKPVHEATKSMTPEQWREARAVAGQMSNAGARRTTIPDAMPETSQLRGVASEISNSTGGGKLYEKLAGRDTGEIARLLDESKGMMQRAAVPNMSPLPGAAHPDQFVADVARTNRTGAMVPQLRNAPLLDESKVQLIESGMRTRAGLPQNAGTEDARYSLGASGSINNAPRYPMPGAAQAPKGFLDAQGMPMKAGPEGVNLEALSKVIKGLENVDSQVGGPAGTVLKNQAALGASRKASDLLKQQSPEYAGAMKTYADMSPQVELTELLAKNKLKAVPNTARSSLTTDTTRADIAALMARIDPTNAPMVTAKMQTADRLAMMKPEIGSEGLQAQFGNSTGASFLQPFGTLARKLNLSSRIGANKELAAILANPTEANFRKLERLAKTDPTAARMMRELGNAGAISSSTMNEGSLP